MPANEFREDMFEDLKGFLARIPGAKVDAHHLYPDERWCINLTIDIDDPLAWHVVQELGSILNNLSVTEKLPTLFKPMSSPPYLNGGPRDYLYWLIEATGAVSPRYLRQLLEGRMPRPVDDRSRWLNPDE
ncbi:hypothetical protein [Bradyrhizobium sp. 23AC]